MAAARHVLRDGLTNRHFKVPAVRIAPHAAVDEPVAQRDRHMIGRQPEPCPVARDLHEEITGAAPVMLGGLQVTGGETPWRADPISAALAFVDEAFDAPASP